MMFERHATFGAANAVFTALLMTVVTCQGQTAGTLYVCVLVRSFILVLHTEFVK